MYCIKRVGLILLCLMAGFGDFGLRLAGGAGPQSSGVQWIWFNEGDPVKGAPAGTRYFRKVFTINRPVQKPVDEATLHITADNAFTVWINGREVGKGNDWKRVYEFDAKPYVVHGKNAIAVQAVNAEGPAGLLVRLTYVPNGMSKMAQGSDGSWKCSKTTAEGWQQVSFDDAKWQAVKVLGSYGQTDPWKAVVWSSSGSDRFTVPPSFKVEMAARNPDPEDPFSLINLTFDNKGRLLVSKENGGVLLCTKPNAQGVFESVKTYCSQVTYCQGMCWVKDALFLVGKGPEGVVGLYRVRDTKGKDKTDEVKLLHKFKGGMGEHGPHAILHGPDDWLYLVIGNHAWAQPKKLAPNSPLARWPTGGMGPDQGKPDTTEDVLLPRLNDSRGHAANILAPGGTIWRLDHEGKNMSLVAAGFRNHYDAAFSRWGELFTFDSDMEWDEALPWYRAVRVCHCPPGADFVWRTGASNTPDYYIDSLPPVLETGRGSPVGLEFYDHHVFPKEYRGAYFMGDWSLGLIWAVHLKRDGASYKGTAEKFCQGAPMNVTDLAVGPDGALYFTMGGRGSQGGVYRIVYPKASVRTSDGVNDPAEDEGIAEQFPQQLAGWSRSKITDALGAPVTQPSPQRGGVEGGARGKEWLSSRLRWIALNQTLSAANRVRALTGMQIYGMPPDVKLVLSLMNDEKPMVRAHAVWLAGVNGYKEAKKKLLAALQDEDAMVRRRACEALVRAGIEPPVDAIWLPLADKDRFVRTAARLVLQRIDPVKWTDQLWAESNEGIVREGIVALCKTNHAVPFTEQIFAHLSNSQAAAASDVLPLLDHLRTVQMALVHTAKRPGSLSAIAEQCCQLFPYSDWRVNRELAILLTYFRRERITTQPVHAVLLSALLANPADRLQQIHYFYCLRLLHEGWTAEQKQALLAWYDSTKTWEGGHSFTPFLENILRGAGPIFTVQDREQIVSKAEQLPWAAIAILRMDSPPERCPSLASLAGLYERLMKAQSVPRSKELKEAIVEALGRSNSSQAQTILCRILDTDPSQRDAVVRILARSPTATNWSYLVRGLESTQANVLFDAVDALKKISVKPKTEDPAPYRSLLLAAGHLTARNRWSAIEVLRHWTNDKRFGAPDGDWKTELTAWSRWFAQTFPKEPALPDLTGDKPVESKYKFGELLAFLETESAGHGGDATRGRIVFEKAQCLKCHKYGREGEGIGPDLTTVSKRFKRGDILESLIYPSKVISDQYRSTTFITKKGQVVDGLAAPQGADIAVLQSDGSKLTLKKSEIDQQFASLVSVMPERLLDLLTKQEIADLFSFLESEPKK
jgi:putative heme-binding domain-containing protein